MNLPYIVKNRKNDKEQWYYVEFKHIATLAKCCFKNGYTWIWKDKLCKNCLNVLKEE